MTTPRIILNNVSFHLPNTNVAFDRVDLCIEKQKIGLVGDNGIGKTTFLNLLVGKLQADSGSIQHTGSYQYLPQQLITQEDASILEILGIAETLDALHRIQLGNASDMDFEKVDNQWDIEARLEALLKQLDLWPITLTQTFSQLSGGQKTKVLLARTQLSNADFILMDEPTNNLDLAARTYLYEMIKKSKKGMLIISHDRALLNNMDSILELSQLGFKLYGGNFDQYKQQKAIKKSAAEQLVHARVELLNKAKNTTQTRTERHQQNEAKGHKAKNTQIKAKGSYDKIEMKSKKGRSEKTNRRIRLQTDRKLEEFNEQLSTAQSHLEIKEDITAFLNQPNVPSQKTLLTIKDLCFHYPETEKPVIDGVNFHFLGPERVAIVGPNGCGKSTLLNLIHGKLLPSSGAISLHASRIAYFDQQVSMLNPALTLVENFLALNPNRTPFDAYSALAAFKFRNAAAEKRVTSLSGGEKMRAGLAIQLMAQEPPQLIILDEPTNHLDLQAIEAIETILRAYQGGILAVSHDASFLEHIGIEKTISLSKKL